MKTILTLALSIGLASLAVADAAETNALTAASARLFTRNYDLKVIKVKNLREAAKAKPDEPVFELFCRFLADNDIHLKPPEACYFSDRLQLFMVRTTEEKLDKITSLMTKVNSDK